MKFETDFKFSDDKAGDSSISNDQGKVLMTLTKPKDRSKVDCDSALNPEVMLPFPTGQGSMEKLV